MCLLYYDWIFPVLSSTEAFRKGFLLKVNVKNDKLFHVSHLQQNGIVVGQKYKCFIMQVIL